MALPTPDPTHYCLNVRLRNWITSSLLVSSTTVAGLNPGLPALAEPLDCTNSTTLYFNAGTQVNAIDTRTGVVTGLADNPAPAEFFDLATAPDGTLYGIVQTGFYSYADSTWSELQTVGNLAGMNLGAFDKYGMLYDIGYYDPANLANRESPIDSVFVRFDPTDLSPAIELVPVADGVTHDQLSDAAGVDRAIFVDEVDTAGDNFFLGGNLYLLAATDDNYDPNTTRHKLLRINMVDTGTEYQWDGTVDDLGYVGSSAVQLPGYGMGVVDGQIFIHQTLRNLSFTGGATEADAISRLDVLPSTADPSRVISLSEDVFGLVDESDASPAYSGGSIYGMAGANEAILDSCAGAPAISTQSLSLMRKDTAFQDFLDMSRYPGSVISVSSGSIPAGLSLDSASGQISGTPTTLGTYEFTITITDPTGATVSKTFSGVVGDTPAAPASPTAQAGAGNATIEWTASNLNFGTLSAYTATANPGGATCTTTGATTCDITGLTPGTSYTFTVTATTEFGTSETSAATAAVTPFDLPGAPTAVSASINGTTASIEWTAPASNGGATITGYTATANPGGATCTTTGATTCDITGLTPGTSYTFTVTATNAGGTSNASTASDSATIDAIAPITGATDAPSTPPSGVGLVVIEDGSVTELPVGLADGAASISDGDIRMTLAIEGGTELSDARIVISERARFDVSGAGFMPGTIVEVWVFSDPILIGTVTVGSDGSFAAALQLPEAVAAGNHTLQLEGQTTDGDTRALVVGLSVPASETSLPVTGQHTKTLIPFLVISVGLLLLASRGRRTVAR